MSNALSDAFNKKENQPKRYLNGARNIDEAVGVFWRIEASYLVKETGERLDFDYVVSAYNRDVVGSYHPGIFPKVVFKKTKNNAILAVDAPITYHSYGFENPPAGAPRDQIPRITWYPNADDNRYAETYVTTDAYHSSRASVEFIDYKVTQVTREDSKIWWEKHLETRDASQTYLKPSDCNDEGVQLFFKSGCVNYFSKQYPDKTNEEKRILIKQERMARTDPKAASVVIWPSETYEAYKKFRVSKDRYVCGSDKVEPLRNFRNWSRVNPEEKDTRRALQKIYNQRGNASHRQRGSIWYTGPKRSKTTALGLSNKIEMFNGNRNEDASDEEKYYSQPVTAFYPSVRHQHPLQDIEADNAISPSFYRHNVIEIITKPEWKGFGLPRHLPITTISNDFKALEYKGTAQSVLYLDGQLICEVPYRWDTFIIFDLDLGRTIHTEVEL